MSRIIMEGAVFSVIENINYTLFLPPQVPQIIGFLRANHEFPYILATLCDILRRVCTGLGVPAAAITPVFYARECASCPARHHSEG
jgi:hypothetical protein